MTLTQRIERSAKDRAHYRRNIVRNREAARCRKIRVTIDRARKAARIELQSFNVSPVATHTTTGVQA